MLQTRRLLFFSLSSRTSKSSFSSRTATPISGWLTRSPVVCRPREFARICNYGLINDFRKFCGLMSARLKRRSRSQSSSSSSSSAPSTQRTLLPYSLCPRPRRSTSPSTRWATLPLPSCRNERELRQLRAIVRSVDVARSSCALDDVTLTCFKRRINIRSGG